MSNPELTPEEVAYYASLRLDDPDEDALLDFASHAGVSTDEVAALSPSPMTAAACRPSSALSPTGARLARTTGARCGVTDVLDKTDLVGGVAGMADAALQTRVVELPGRALTSTTAVQCFLNATHLYLQHNALTSLEGLELLQELRVLVVHHNALTSAAPLKELRRLFYVDMGHNALPSLDVVLAAELPCAGLRYLTLSGNPCAWSPADSGPPPEAYEAAVRAACPALEFMDGHRLASDTASDEDEDGNAGETSAEASPTRDGTERRHGSRRAHELVEAARAGGGGPSSSHRHPNSGTTDDAGRPLSASTSASTSAKPTTALEREEERLVRQLQQHGTRPRPGSATAEGLYGDPSDVSTDDAGSAAAGGVGDALHLFQGLQYTQDVTQARQQRDLAAHWDDVDRVLQTAQGLQLDRRRRMHERLQSNTEAYAATLQLLEKESYTQNLDRYRTGTAGGARVGGEEGTASQARSVAPSAATAAAASVPTPKQGAPLATASEKRKSSVGRKGEKPAPKHVPKPPPLRR